MNPAADKLLNAIEQVELRSLVWGDVDSSLSEDEILKLAAETVGQDAAEDLLEDLIDRRLVYEFPIALGAETRRLRSRFAELVRLLVRLRQIFPREDWRGAPRLVSDFRVDVRPRRFPKRDVSASDLLEELVSSSRITPLQGETWKALTAVPSDEQFMLAGFQGRSVFRLVRPPDDSGTIITAGTGSGKTLAFYLPAILHIVSKIRPNDFWTKAIAVYPRRELLKDQLTEVLRNGRRIEETLNQNGHRPLVVGAFYGEMPNSPHADDRELERKGWRVRTRDVVCPIARCPECNDQLVWLATDREKQREHLVCDSDDCVFDITSETFPLTRQSVQKRPPDILFTTTETLNQRMSDGRSRLIFGLGQPPNRRPSLMLLDEVHTYTGASGAQVALLLRRWRRLLDSPVAFIGLSATLEEPSHFFQQLCGTAPERTVQISPDPDEMTEASAEYQLALRGDPVSQTALLSTSIQSAILLGRMLDPRGNCVSGGSFGQRLFVFTDDLDVTHRLYDDLHDAEAYTRFRRPDPGRSPLAALRAVGSADDNERNVDGQLWRLPEQIGHNLNNRLLLGRTTSRDPGVTGTADVIVATASLEVGFNDPLVGAVLQHKAPHSPAAFVQRRGRAGRPRGMRPITVTVLSDYGRDRRAFQAYEHLFDPHLPAQSLPIKNQYVLRIQATFALIDWLLEQCPENERDAWLYRILSMPRDETGPEWKSTRTVRRHVERTLTSLVRGEQSSVDSLHRFLTQALTIDDEEAAMILWQPPRSLLLEVIPTLVRRLFRDWQKAFPDGNDKLDNYTPWRPLPEYLPANLFSDINLPDVQIVVPPSASWNEAKIESLPIGSALGQLVPGRVTRRFADEYGDLAHWIAVDPSTAVVDLNVSDYARRNEYVGHFVSTLAQPSRAIPVFRPLEIELARVTKSQALPTSQSRFCWESELESKGESLDLDMPDRASWSTLIARVSFWLHQRQTNVSVRRFASNAVANIRRRGIDEAIVDVRLVDDQNQTAAVGFEIAVDGLCVDVVLPDVAALSARSLPSGLQAVLRTAYFRDLVKDDEHLPRDVNLFQRDWLQQIFLSAVLLRAERDECALSDAIERLSAEGARDPYVEVMDAIFAIQEVQAVTTETDEEVEVDDNGQADENGRRHADRIGRLKRRLGELFDDSAVRDRLGKNLDAAVAPEAKSWGEWLRQAVAETLAQALMEAALNATPQQAALNALVVDRVDTPEATKLWLTETTLGGTGVVQALAERFASQPGGFLQALEAALSPGDLELAANGLARTVNLATTDSVIADRLAETRKAVGHAERGRARDGLIAAVAQRGVLAGHSWAVAVAARLLRAGSSRQTDQLLCDLLARWDALEVRHGIATGLREYAYIATVLQPDIRDRLEELELIGPAEPSSCLVQILAGLLWPRGPEVRQHTLQSYNPYRNAHFADAALTRILLLDTPTPVISLENPDWVETLHAALVSEGSARLGAAVGNSAGIRDAILKTVSAPIEVGPLHLFPAIERMEQDGEKLLLTLSLREVAGW